MNKYLKIIVINLFVFIELFTPVIHALQLGENYAEIHLGSGMVDDIFDSGYNSENQIDNFQIEQIGNIQTGTNGDIFIKEMGNDTENIINDLSGNLLKLNSEIISGSSIYNGVTVYVKALQNTFPEGTILNISPIEEKADKQKIENIMIDQIDLYKPDVTAVSFDISFIYNEKEIQPIEGKTVEVKFYYEDNDDFNKIESNENLELVVYHINENKENQKEIVEQIEIVDNIEGTVSIQAKSFSVYVVAIKDINSYELEEDIGGTGMIYDQLKNIDFTWQDIIVEKPEDFKCLSGATCPDKIIIMDRNLGATCNNKDEKCSYGYYYQWGNNYGFELVDDKNIGEVKTEILVETVTKGYYDNNFVVNKNGYDWVVQQNDSLRGGATDGEGNFRGLENIQETVKDRQGPCPDGYHIPSRGEFILLFNYYGLTDSTELDLDPRTNRLSSEVIDQINEKFKFPYASSLDRKNGIYKNGTPSWKFWTSSAKARESNPKGVASNILFQDNYISNQKIASRATADSIRCFKNKPNYYVEFKEGDDVYAKIEVNSELGIIKQPNRPEEKEGYVFLGRFTEKDGGEEWNFDNNISGDMILYARWSQCQICEPGKGAFCELNTKNNSCNYQTYCNDGYENIQHNGEFNPSCSPITYNITYNLNGGINNPENPFYYTIESETILLKEPLKTGYIFNGWTHTGFLIPENNVTILNNTTGNILFVANWTEKNDTKYNVRHLKESLDGTYVVSDIEYLSGTTLGMTNAVPKFYTGFTVKPIVQGIISADGLTYVDIMYDRNEYELVINEDNGNTPIVMNVKYESPIELSIPVKIGYLFSGWDLDYVTMPSNNLVYTAIWNKEIVENQNESQHKTHKKHNKNNKDLHDDNTDEGHNSPGEIDFGNLDEFIISDEMKNAYIYAYKNGLVDENFIDFKIDSPIKRIELAEILSNYSINVLGKKPDVNLYKQFFDVSDLLDKTYGFGSKLSYQLGIMGINMGDEFRPFSLVTRAELSTALSRLLYNVESKDLENYFQPHIEILYNEGIISIVDPGLVELKGYLLLMLYRASFNK